MKFWNFELIHDPNNQIKAKVLSVVHTRTLKLEESVLCIRMSPNNRFIAVSLLDSTIKIFFLDTFKVTKYTYSLNFIYNIIFNFISYIHILL